MADAVLITALPADVSLRLYTGDDFTMSIEVSDTQGQPFDLSGATVRAHIRASMGSPDIAGQFDCAINGNVIVLALTSATSTTLGLGRTAVWDVEITNQGVVTTLARGTISLDPEVTHD